MVNPLKIACYTGAVVVAWWVGNFGHKYYQCDHCHPDGRWAFVKSIWERNLELRQIGANAQLQSSPIPTCPVGFQATKPQLAQLFQVPRGPLDFDPACISTDPNINARYLKVIRTQRKAMKYIYKVVLHQEVPECFKDGMDKLEEEIEAGNIRLYHEFAGRVGTVLACLQECSGCEPINFAEAFAEL